MKESCNKEVRSVNQLPERIVNMTGIRFDIIDCAEFPLRESYTQSYVYVKVKRIVAPNISGSLVYTLGLQVPNIT